MLKILEFLFGRPGGLLSTLTLLLVDAILINAAFVTAYFARYELEIGGTVEEVNFVPLSVFLPVQLTLTAITLLVLFLEGLYRSPRRSSWATQLVIIIHGTMIAVAIMIIIVFAFRPYFFSRLIFAQTWVFMALFLSLARLAEESIRGMLRKRGIGVVRLLIVGAGKVGRTIMQNLVAQPELGYQVVGFVDDDPEKRQDIGRFKALGSTSDVPRLVEDLAVDEVIITLPWMSHNKIMSIMSHCQRRGVEFKFVPDLFHISLSQVDVEELNGIPLIGMRQPSLQIASKLVKRAVDVLAAAIALLLFAPLMLLIAIAIKLDSPGPIIFAQTRIGQGGRPFTLYKFRSMRQGAEGELEQLRQRTENTEITFKLKNDPRCTRVGRIIRRASLDELPQLFNVLRGEMSLVGPRPPIPSEVEQYEDWHRKRLEVKPGITGLWQVMGRSELPFEEMVMLDIYYIENWSLLLDFKILLRTIPTVLLARGAY